MYTIACSHVSTHERPAIIACYSTPCEPRGRARLEVYELPRDTTAIARPWPVDNGSLSVCVSRALSSSPNYIPREEEKEATRRVSVMINKQTDKNNK